MKTFKPASKIKVGNITSIGEILAVETQPTLFGKKEMVFLVPGLKKRKWIFVPEENELEITKFPPLFFEETS